MARQPTENDLSRLLTARLNAYLKRTGMNQSEFGRKAHVSSATIGQIVNGKARPSQPMVERIEAAMKEEGSIPAPQPLMLDPTATRILEKVLEAASKKAVREALVTHALREMEGGNPEKVKHIVESLIRGHLAALEESRRVDELLKLLDISARDA